VVLGVGLIWAAWASAPAVESAARPAAPAARGAAGQSEGSVLDGVFTEAQATRGEATFRRVCSACHDTNEFSGGRFRLTWVGQSAADLFDTIATLMPEGDPGSLTPAQYAGVVAYLLQLNGYPAGEAALPTTLSALRGLEIVAAP
jgi:mono/diheme cytochrome c family protein